MPIGVGDKVPVLPGGEGEDIVIAPSIVGEGDTVVVLQDKNGDDIICCNGAIGVGDTVIVGKDQDGNDVIIKPGGCVPVDLKLIDEIVYTHHSYSYELSEEFTITDRFNYPQLNLKIDWIKRCQGGSDPPTIPKLHPCGAVWVGLGSPDSYGDPGEGSWLWRLYPNPYATLGAGFDMDLRTGATIGNLSGGMGKLHWVDQSGGECKSEWCIWRWCIPNLLYYYTGPQNNVNDFTVRYIHIHTRNTVSLFFGGDGAAISYIADIKMCHGNICTSEEDNLCRDNKWCLTGVAGD